MKRQIFILLLTISFQVSAEQWLCVTEQMTGFYQDKNTGLWKPGTFNDTPKFVVSSYAENSVLKYKVKQHGSNYEFKCQDYINEVDEYFIICQDKYGSSFLFNKSRNRFQFSNVIGGYVYPYLKNKTPFMSIGLCSEF